jgi:hypothetical protein
VILKDAGCVSVSCMIMLIPMLIRTSETSIPRNSESFHVFPTENEPFVLSFDL